MPRDDRGMTLPMGVSGQAGGPTGYTYSAVLLRADDRADFGDEHGQTTYRL